jgi:hypothetical protein
MNALFFVKGSTGLIVLLAAVFALLTQLQVRKIPPAILNVKNPVLLTWHRWAGRIALGGFVLTRMICQLVGVYPTFPLEARHFAHGVLSALCAAAILSKIWVTRRQVRWGKKRILTWVVTTFIVGASFSTLTGALAAWRWANPTVIWGKNEWLIYRAATLGHVGLAIALIWLGRLALVNGRCRDQVNTFVECGVTGGHRIAKKSRRLRVFKYIKAKSLSFTSRRNLCIHVKLL